MPNLGPGVPNNTNLTFTPTWLFTPSSSGINNLRLYNNGRNTVYVGQAEVTVNTGLPILPGGKPVELTNVQNSLYAISAYQVGTLLGTVQTAATAGTTTITFSSTVPVATLGVGGVFMIGSTSSTSNQEALSVASTTATSVLTTSTATAFAHGVTDVVYAITPSYGQLSVIGGVL
jgi:hypothetical protein